MFKKENIQIFINDSWKSYKKMKMLVGGFHYSSAIRFYDESDENYVEIKIEDYSSIAFPFYYKSDPTKSYKSVFDSEHKTIDSHHLFYIYDEFIDYFLNNLKVKDINNQIIDFKKEISLTKVIDSLI